MRQSQDFFICQQGFPVPNANPHLYSALMVQPRMVGGLVVLGIVFNDPRCSSRSRPSWRGRSRAEPEPVRCDLQLHRCLPARVSAASRRSRAATVLASVCGSDGARDRPGAADRRDIDGVDPRGCGPRLDCVRSRAAVLCTGAPLLRAAANVVVDVRRAGRQQVAAVLTSSAVGDSPNGAGSIRVENPTGAQPARDTAAAVAGALKTRSPAAKGYFGADVLFIGMSTSTRLILGLAMSLLAPATSPGSPPPAVVIAELFTSEGCSSCPPADTLLRQFAEAQPFDGAQLIALEEHVDYWDRLGWRDPFSSAQFTTRQTEYSDRVFRTTGIYTPQLVVDGVRECVGSDRSAFAPLWRIDPQTARGGPRAIRRGRVASQRDGQHRRAGGPRTSRRRRRLRDRRRTRLGLGCRPRRERRPHAGSRFRRPTAGASRQLVPARSRVRWNSGRGNCAELEPQEPADRWCDSRT